MSYKFDNNASSATIFQLWPIPVYKSNIPVRKETLEYCEKLEYYKNEYNKGYTSSNHKVLNDLYVLKKNIYDELKVFLDYLKVDKQLKFYFEQSWVFKLEKESVVHKHLHENSLISGVYYEKLPDEKNEITFSKSSSYINLFHTSVTIPFTEQNQINSKDAHIPIANGDLLFFPSHLEHSVLKMIPSTRYSMSFNIFPRGKVDDIYGVKL